MTSVVDESPPAGSDDDFNLAARVYGGGNRAGGANGWTAAAATRRDGYNLAARVYGAPVHRNGNGHTNGHGNGLATYPNGNVNGRGGVAVAAASAAAPAAVAPADVRRREGGGRFRTFDAFRLYGFRWYFLAMLGQMASMNMQMLVRGYLVFLLTGSYAALGVISLANAIPGLTLSLIGGVLADRVRQKKYVVQVGQFVNAINALVVAILLYFHVLRFEHLFISSVVQGMVMALMMPARQSMIPEIVGLDRLMNAVALNSAGMNTMRLVAPAAGGFLLAVFGPHWIYFLMTGMYLIAVVFLFPVPKISDDVVRAAALRRSQRGGGGVSQMFDGIRYIAKEPTLRAILSVNVLLIVMAMPYIFLLPGFVADVLDEGPGALGMLLSATGAGSLAGALIVASLPPKRRGFLFLVSSGIQGIGLLAFSASTWFWVTLPIMVFMGLGQAGRQSFSNVLVQTYVNEDYRGRVMAVYMLQFSLTSFGTFFVGLLAAVIGAQLALGMTSALMVIIAFGALLFVPRLRNLQ